MQILYNVLQNFLSKRGKLRVSSTQKNELNTWFLKIRWGSRIIHLLSKRTTLWIFTFSLYLHRNLKCYNIMANSLFRRTQSKFMEIAWIGSKWNSKRRRMRGNKLLRFYQVNCVINGYLVSAVVYLILGKNIENLWKHLWSH